jgi:hypothetical protein
MSIKPVISVLLLTACQHLLSGQTIPDSTFEIVNHRCRSGLPIFAVGSKLNISEKTIELNSANICRSGFVIEKLGDEFNRSLKTDVDTWRPAFKDYKCLDHGGQAFEQDPFKRLIYSQSIHCPKTSTRSSNISMMLLNLDNKAYILIESTCHYCLKKVE